ncbi:MAG: hypothetical protein MJY71_03990 [Bacteroidaceae bacterium]|nr:hypothetical protein [Bacteroidaceae bacterium]
MASRRLLKKEIKYIVDQLLVEYLFVETGCKENNRENLDKALDCISDLNDEFISRIAHTEQNNPKAYYKAFYKDFNAKVNEIMNLLVQK